MKIIENHQYLPNEEILQAATNVIQLDDYRKSHLPHKKKKDPDRPVITKAADAIKDPDILEVIEQHLISTGKYGQRNYLIFYMGLNVGRRCGDLLSLKIKDIFDGERMREEVEHREQKTQKVIRFYLAPELQAAFYKYIQSTGPHSPDDYLFTSQKGGPLSRKSYWKILKSIRDELDLNFRLSTHSMRKTWAYSLYQKYKGVLFEGGYDIVDQLEFMLGHSDRLITLHYIGIDAEVSKKLYNENVIGGSVLK